MARNKRLTVTLKKETYEILDSCADVEHRSRTDVANRLLRAASLAFGTEGDLVRFTRQLEGEAPEAPERLDVAELRVKSREALDRLEGMLREFQRVANGLRSTLEAEAQAARMAKARRLRGSTLLGARS